MAHTVVKILSGDDLEPIAPEDQFWCLSVMFGDSPRTFCRSEAYGPGESACEYEEIGSVEKGHITCPRCLKRIKEIKQIKL